jgi:N utilization substance protein A
MEVIVPDEFLSVAIGKRGQNVRLASKLTGWYLDVKSESRYSQAMKDGYDSLVKLPGIGISLADALYEKGFFSAEELSTASVQDLTQIRGIAEEKALKIIESAIEVMADEKVEESLSEETSADINDTTDIDDSEDQIIEEQPQPDMTTRNETSEESLSEKTPADINDTTDIDDSEGQIIEEQPKPDPTTRNEASEALAPSENSEAIKNDGARGTDTQKSSEENSG